MSLELGIAFYTQKKFPEAIEHLEKAGNESSTLYNLGCAYTVTKAYQKADETFRRVISLYPLDEKRNLLLYGLANCLYLMEKYDESLEFCNRALSLPNLSDDHLGYQTYLQGLILDKLRKPLEAWFALRHALNFYSPHDPSYSLLKENYSRVDKQIEHLL
jgi:tetratricopeptide (TPR) repeat protein